MKTITKTYDLYEYKELSAGAKERALKDYNDSTVEYPFLEEDIKETCKGLLTNNGIEGDPKVSYSLSWCQGDGAMFYGSFIWKDYNVYITHTGRYSHSNSKNIVITDKHGEILSTKAHMDFETIYQSICKELEKVGYKHIEHEQSEENFKDICGLNGYTFTSDGKMMNE